ncbi:MAG: response regulator transcription factor [Bacteroidia bacterium]|nr:response regulator transcription factor [Bacteroidia bacterium]
MAKNKKILIVDDEPDILEILEYNLTESGYKVAKAEDGLEALSQAKSFQPDLILLDIMLPGMDGVEVCAKIREDPELDNCLVAFLTARGEDFTEIASLEVGGDDFIQKPIKPKVLLSRIKALLRRSKRSEEDDNEILEYKNIKLDQNQFLVFVGGKKVDLPKKEFYILKLLMSNPGRVYRRAEIFNKIWGDNVIVGNRTIDVHIRKLRERIGEKRIKTVKGVGYKVD